MQYLSPSILLIFKSRNIFLSSVFSYRILITDFVNIFKHSVQNLGITVTETKTRLMIELEE